MKLFLGIASLATLLHLVLFDQIPLQFDELLMFEVIQRYNFLQLIPFLYTEEIQQPLAYYWTKLFMLIAKSTFVLRLPSLITLFIIPFAFYKLAKLKLLKEDALKATTLLMLFYPVMMFSGSMRPYVPFLLFTIIGLYNFLKPEKNKIHLTVSLLLLFLIHPLGSFISLLLAAGVLFREKNGIRIFTVIAFLLTVLGTAALLFRHEELKFLITGFTGFSDYFTALYNFSFLVSGRWFAALLGIMFAIVIWNRFKRHEIHLNIDRLWIHTTVWSLLLAAFLMLFFGKHLYPRHFIYLLPGLAIVTIQLINAVTRDPKRRNALFALACLTLLHKVFVTEKIHLKPHEIDSYSIAKLSKELSESEDIPLVSCGNCFNYYLKDNKQFCVGRFLPQGFIGNFKKVIYVELDYVKTTCGIQNITGKHKVLSSYPLIGGSVNVIEMESN